MVIKTLFLVLLACIGFTACSFQERSFKDLACVSDQECSRPDQECRTNVCTQRECSPTATCPVGHEFSCSSGLCVAAECTTTASCSNGYACNEGFCQASFNVTGVVSLSNTSIAVTFDSPPDPTTAGAAANYAVNGLSLTGTATLNGSTVTLGTSTQTATSYSVTVSNVVRDFDGAPLIIATGTFTGRGPFSLVSATSTSAVSVALTFSEPPDPVTAANFGNYSILNSLNQTLAVSTSPAPTLAGNVVTLTTGTQASVTYTVTVANVVRASDAEALATNIATFSGRTDFNISSIETRSSTQIAVTFDAAPNVTQAVTLANYSVPGLTLTGTPTLVGSVVTITTSAQADQLYTLAVTGVTRASDGEPLTVASKDFQGRPPFNVVDALARSTRLISVTFDAPPDPGDAIVLSNYAVSGLALSGTPLLAGNVVFLTTATQAATPYTVTVMNVRRAGDLEALATSMAIFDGRPPFDVATASATSSTSVAVTFSDPPNSGQAILAGNYALSGGVTVLSASAPSGNTVTLTTTPMTGAPGPTTTYTLTVAGVTRATDGEALSTSTRMFAGRAPYNVASAAAPTSSTISVTFDAPPSNATAMTLANYDVPGLTLTGTPALSGSTVTLTTTTQLAQTYTITVTGVTRASDGEPLATNTASFTGRTRFNVASASSGSNVSVRVTFDAPPNIAQAMTLANYNVPGLGLSGTPAVSGNVVTITTANQTGTAPYTVTVSGVTRASDSEPLTTNSAAFTGLSGFNVTGAASVNTTSVAVTFDAPPTAGPAQTPANYMIAGLSVTAAAYPGTGNTVTLTTSSQSNGAYTVVVAGAVTRASDSSPLVVTSAQFTYASFNVSGAAGVTNKSASVTFDAAPTAAQAIVQGNYSVNCPNPCANITLTAPVLVGNTVTLTTSAQQAGKTYTITVNNVTRSSDGSSLSVKTGAFVGRSAFNVVSAAAPTSGTMTVTFDAAPLAAAATTLASYTVPGLTLSGTPLLSGNVVTINTSVQASQSYSVTVSNVTRASDGEPLFVKTATFTGKAQTNPTVTGVTVQSTVPDNGTTFYNTGTATVVITGTEFNGVSCATGVKLDDVDGNGNLINTKPVLGSCTVNSATTITATFPAGIQSSYAGWNVQVTNSIGTNAASTGKLVVKAGLLVSEIYVGSNGGSSDVKEFLEVYNPTANTLNVDTLGLTIHTRDSAGVDGTLALGFSGGACVGVCTKDIPSHKYWLIVSTSSTNDTWYSHRNAVYQASTRQLVTNGSVYLSLSGTAQSMVIDKAGWGTQLAITGREGNAIAAFGNDNKSAQRKPSTTTSDTDTDANSADFNTPSTTISPKGTRD